MRQYIMAGPSSLQIFFLGAISVLALVTVNLYVDLSRPVQVLRPLRRFVYVNKSLVSPAYRVCKAGPPLGYPEQAS